MDVQKYLRRKTGSKVNMDNLQVKRNHIFLGMEGKLCKERINLTSSRRKPAQSILLGQPQLSHMPISEFFSDVIVSVLFQ